MLVGVLAGPAGAYRSKTGKDDMREMSEAQAAAEVQRYADQVAAEVGQPLSNPATHSAPCESDGTLHRADGSIRSMTGFYNIWLSAGQHLTTLTRLRDQWRARGWTINEERLFPDNLTGVLAASTGAEDFSISLSGVRDSSGEPPVGFLLMVGSPCYRSTDGS